MVIRPARLRGAVLLLAFATGALQASGLVFPQQPAADSDAAILAALKGKAASLLTLRGEEQRVAYANIDKLTSVSSIRRGAAAHPLERATRDLSSFTYTHNGTSATVDDFMSGMRVVGLIVVTDGRIVLERYARDHTPDTRWVSFSVAKSVTSLLYGAALMDGAIGSLDDPVSKYLPALKSTPYDAVRLRNLLQMSSGVRWREEPGDPTSDVSQLARLNKEGLDALLAYVSKLPRRAEPGSVFNYNTAETDLAGAVLKAATGRGLSDYLSDKIWGPFGMESDATWITMNGGLERGGCCISATLRDYARIGLLALGGGTARDGRRLLREGWIREATTPSSTARHYGYYWWLRPNGRYFASGSFGQHIEVAPAERTVVAIQSYWPAAFNDDLIGHNDTFVDALIGAAAASPPR